MTEQKDTSSKTTSKKTPWARRREMNLATMCKKVRAEIALIQKLKPEAFEDYELDQATMLTAYQEVEKALTGMEKALGELPDEFPPMAAKKTKATKKGFEHGDCVLIREKHHDKYAGAFDPTPVMEVTPQEIGGGYIAVKHPTGGNFFITKSHLMHAPEAA